VKDLRHGASTLSGGDSGLVLSPLGLVPRKAQEVGFERFLHALEIELLDRAMVRAAAMLGQRGLGEMILSGKL
jgi:hypothetical protein